VTVDSDAARDALWHSVRQRVLTTASSDADSAVL